MFITHILIESTNVMIAHKQNNWNFKLPYRAGAIFGLRVAKNRRGKNTLAKYAYLREIPHPREQKWSAPVPKKQLRVRISSLSLYKQRRSNAYTLPNLESLKHDIQIKNLPEKSCYIAFFQSFIKYIKTK